MESLQTSTTALSSAMIYLLYTTVSSPLRYTANYSAILPYWFYHDPLASSHWWIHYFAAHLSSEPTLLLFSVRTHLEGQFESEISSHPAPERVEHLKGCAVHVEVCQYRALRASFLNSLHHKHKSTEVMATMPIMVLRV